MSLNESSAVPHVSGRRDDSHASPKILIIQQPARFAFSDEWFQVSLDISSAHPSGKDTDEVELCCNLHRYVNDSILPEPVKDSHAINLQLLVHQKHENRKERKGTKHTIAKCKIRSPLSHDRRPVQYSLCFCYRSKQTGEIIEEIERAYSVPGKSYHFHPI